jgi:HlyD family secretion protein
LLRVALHEGDSVKAGETLLAVIVPGDPSLLDVRARAEIEARVKAAEARRLHAQAQLARVKATLEFARTEFARAEKLLPSQSVSREAYEVAMHQLRTASEDLKAGEFAVSIAQFELQQAQAALLRTKPLEDAGDTRFEIRSPINGEVLRVVQESAAVLAPGALLMEVGDPADLEVEIDVLSSDAVRIPLGAKVYLDHWGESTPLIARVRVVEPKAFLKVSALGVEEQRVNVIADFVDSSAKRKRLGDAYRVEARIVVWAGQDLLKANAGAFFRHAGGWAVYRIEKGRARLTAVEVGHSNGLETEILSGLSDKDEIVAYPSDQVSDGARVAPRRNHR